MKQLKNKILIKVNRKLIFIFSLLTIISINIFGQEWIEFTYYDYTNKLYHSTLKTELIPSEYIFITTFSNYNTNKYLYNIKTKEKKLFHIYRDYKYYEYYDIKGNLTTNWADTNMSANSLYKITNNRFGETFYNVMMSNEKSIYPETGDYIKKAYKYSLTQPEIINKKDRGIYLFRKLPNYHGGSSYVSFLCFQNEYYTNDAIYGEGDLLNYTSNGSILFANNLGRSISILSYDYYYGVKTWNDNRYWNDHYTNNIYFKLSDKSFIKPTWVEFTNNYLKYMKNLKKDVSFKYSMSNEEINHNLNVYRNANDIQLIVFIPIEEFEYYLLKD